MLNHITVMGRLARDPELRHTQNGTPVASFRLAVDRDFKDKDTGERVTDWIDCVAWRSTGEFVSNYFIKGRMAVVEGRLQIRDWMDKDGVTRHNAEIVVENIFDYDPDPVFQYHIPRLRGFFRSIRGAAAGQAGKKQAERSDRSQ